MGTAAFFWNNRLIGATLAASAETADGPIGNIVKQQVVTAWRALGDAASFTADLATAADLQFLALLGVSLGASATLRLRLSSSSAHGGDLYDSGTVAANAASVLDGRKQCLVKLPAIVSARYVKLDLADAGAAFIDVGFAFLGDWWRPEHNFSWGFGDGVRSTSNKEPSLGGQVYTLRRPKQRVKTFALNFLTPAEAKAQSREISDRAGDHAPFGMIPDPDAADAAAELIIGTLADLGEVTGVALQVRGRSFELAELL